MSYELFVGLRYLRAKRKQTFVSVITVISVLGITVGVSALIIVLSVMSGFEDTLKDKILGLNAHVVVLGMGHGIEDYDRVAETVRGVKGVAGASPFTYNQALLSSKASAVGVVVRGLDVKTAGEATVVPQKIREGSLEGLAVGLGSKKGRLPGLLLGSELARRLSVRVGDSINLISPTGTMTPAGPVPRMTAFRVSGIFELGMYEYDSSLAFISLRNAQKFFRLGDTATGVEVKLRDIDEARAVADEIMRVLKGPYWTKTWEDMNRSLFSALKLEKVTMFIILTLIILVAALNIISTLIMVVMEKHKDIAILKGIGASPAGIMKIFMVEGAVIGFVGTLAGAAFGVGVALNLEWVVSLIEGVFKFKILPPSVYYIDKLPSHVEPATVAVIVAFSLGISFLATLYPSWQAARMRPVDSLRYE
jgi:lipoprotein-releasing system permease protein